jgi:glycyl-tRNA synthetase alpha chain
VWLDGMEISQFTYFQQVGGIDLHPISTELTYGLERIAMFIQKKESVYDLDWTDDVRYGEVHHQDEIEFSRYNFEVADVDSLLAAFDAHEAEGRRALEAKLVGPAYDQVLRCSHAFNMLDARGAIGVNERAQYIGRVRRLASACAKAYLEQREELGFPLLRETETAAS